MQTANVANPDRKPKYRFIQQALKEFSDSPEGFIQDGISTRDIHNRAIALEEIYNRKILKIKSLDSMRERFYSSGFKNRTKESKRIEDLKFLSAGEFLPYKEFFEDKNKDEKEIVIKVYNYIRDEVCRKF
jgi:hypothetical protein